MRGTATKAMASRPWDIVIYGATGFTGKLAVKYLKSTYPTLKFGVAGRNAKALRALVDNDAQVIVADSQNDLSLDAMAASTKVLLTFAGPYALIGSNVVAACIRNKCDYVDITGEVPWVRKMIDKHDSDAKAANVRVVHCSGFDSIPSDLGCMHMVNSARSRGVEPEEVRMIVGDSKGGASGGTIASAINIITSTPLAELQKFANPFALCARDPTTGEPDGPQDINPSMDCMTPGYDSVFKTYTAPWIMQGVNTRVVNYSNSLLGWEWGRNFRYTERQGTGLVTACITALALPVFSLLLFVPITRWLLQKLVLPKQGEGPSEELRETGFFRMKFWAKGRNTTTGEMETLKGGIDAFEGDPGYKQTAKMASEAALCLLDSGLPARYGVLTPASAMGEALQARLEEQGIHFYIDE